MIVNKNDLAHIDNILKALKKAEFKLDGVEVLALAETVKWINMLGNRVNEALQKQEAEAAKSAVEQNKPAKTKKKTEVTE